MPILEERQIYRSGKSSFAITLPAGWVKYLKLKPGDRVEVEVDGELTIRPLRRPEDGKEQNHGQADH